jgi:hypothetical protein
MDRPPPLSLRPPPGSRCCFTRRPLPLTPSAFATPSKPPTPPKPPNRGRNQCFPKNLPRAGWRWSSNSQFEKNAEKKGTKMARVSIMSLLAAAAISALVCTVAADDNVSLGCCVTTEKYRSFSTYHLTVPYVLRHLENKS